MDTVALRGIEYGLHGPWDIRRLREAREPMPREGVQDVANSLDATADVLGHRGWGMALRTGP